MYMQVSQRLIDFSLQVFIGLWLTVAHRTQVKLVFQLMHTYSYWDLCACSLLHTITSMHIHMYMYMSVYQVH